MNCIITGSNVKTRTVNFFSKIGNELQLEALPTGLCLKAINSMNTAYVMANFHKSFFISFRQGANDRFEENNCKISIKPVLRIFKSLAKIQLCKIWLQLDRMKIIFQFKCKSDVLKTHIITLLEHEHVNALRLPEDFPNKIVGDHKIFSNILVHFHNSIDEITFNTEAEQIVVTNYIEDTTKERTAMRSTFTVENTAFRLYQLESPSNITFCYKEFKAMAYFAEHNRMVVEMNFDQAGTPIMIRMKKENVLSINFIIGTMRPRLAKENRSVQRANRKLMDNSKHKQTSVSNNSQMLDSSVRNSRIRENNSEQEIDLPLSMVNQPVAAARRTPIQTEDSYDIVFAGNTDDPNSESQALTPTLSGKRPGSPSHNVLNSNEKRQNTRSENVFSEDRSSVRQTIPESVPESPEAAAQRRQKQEKLRRVLGKCFETTFDPRRMAGSSQTYAEDSDPDDK
ncbi:DNA repair protein rad9 [Culex quinquefasciatus]|uniref:DNA repair protein rad9 n=1 Tax=Culex quinquefasciatus TaxID=7176 RepID=B0X122_CULQU|nr:DNA repair protein rad9 [Culex quinquefasciatus]|eukprot:XP_001863344.1 DNA repair protein rad9 [Culex quinquefasciatus]